MLTRRAFIGRAATAAFGGLAAATGLTACIDTRDPNRVELDLTSPELAAVKEERIPYRHEEGFFVVPYPTSPREAQGYVDAGVAARGLMVLSAKCPTDGCSVRFCEQSRWFECPCHGDKFNMAGEHKIGPAERGMDRFRMSVSGDILTVLPTLEIQGPPRGTNTTSQEKEGPFCI